MDDAALVSRIERIDNLTRDRHGLRWRHWTTHDAIGERRTFYELHHQRPDGASVFQAVNVRDVLVVQRRQRSCFTREPGESFLLACDVFREDLDGHVATEFQVASAIDLAHSALADLGGDLIPAEPSARSERQGGQLRL